MRLAALVAVLMIACFAARAHAESPPWTVIGHGAGAIMLPAGRRPPFAVVIDTKAASKAYPDLTVQVGHPPCTTPCEWYDTFDWRDDVVIFVVAQLPYEFEISKIVRHHASLRVIVGKRYPAEPDAPKTFTTWETVAVLRSLIGGPLPRRVMVATG